MQLGIFLKKILKGGGNSLSKSEFLEIISQYLSQRSNLVSSDLSKFCTCGGKTEFFQHIISHSSDHTQRIDIQHKQLLVRLSVRTMVNVLSMNQITVFFFNAQMNE